MPVYSSSLRQETGRRFRRGFALRRVTLRRDDAHRSDVSGGGRFVHVKRPDSERDQLGRQRLRRREVNQFAPIRLLVLGRLTGIGKRRVAARDPNRNLPRTL